VCEQHLAPAFSTADDDSPCRADGHGTEASAEPPLA
jgi:hypothetical protein